MRSDGGVIGDPHCTTRNTIQRSPRRSTSIETGACRRAESVATWLVPFLPRPGHAFTPPPDPTPPTRGADRRVACALHPPVRGAAIAAGDGQAVGVHSLPDRQLRARPRPVV